MTSRRKALGGARQQPTAVDDARITPPAHSYFKPAVESMFLFMTKTRFAEAAISEWAAYAIPEHLISDNGKDLVSRHLFEMAKRLKEVQSLPSQTQSRR